MARTEEITGGAAGFPIAASDWAAINKFSIAGFIMPNGGAVTNIVFKDGKDYLAMYDEDYSACQEGMYYHFPFSVISATFSDVATIYYK